MYKLHVKEIVDNMTKEQFIEERLKAKLRRRKVLQKGSMIRSLAGPRSLVVKMEEFLAGLLEEEGVSEDLCTKMMQSFNSTLMSMSLVESDGAASEGDDEMSNSNSAASEGDELLSAGGNRYDGNSKVCKMTRLDPSGKGIKQSDSPNGSTPDYHTDGAGGGDLDFEMNESHQDSEEEELPLTRGGRKPSSGLVIGNSDSDDDIIMGDTSGGMKRNESSPRIAKPANKVSTIKKTSNNSTDNNSTSNIGSNKSTTEDSDEEVEPTFERTLQSADLQNLNELRLPDGYEWLPNAFTTTKPKISDILKNHLVKHGLNRFSDSTQPFTHTLNTSTDMLLASCSTGSGTSNQHRAEARLKSIFKIVAPVYSSISGHAKHSNTSKCPSGEGEIVLRKLKIMVVYYAILAGNKFEEGNEMHVMVPLKKQKNKEAYAIATHTQTCEWVRDQICILIGQKATTGIIIRWDLPPDASSCEPDAEDVSNSIRIPHRCAPADTNINDHIHILPISLRRGPNAICSKHIHSNSFCPGNCGFDHVNVEELNTSQQAELKSYIESTNRVRYEGGGRSKTCHAGHWSTMKKLKMDPRLFYPTLGLAIPGWTVELENGNLVYTTEGGERITGIKTKKGKDHVIVWPEWEVSDPE